MTATHPLRRIGLTLCVAVSGALLFALALHVNALKSEVRRAELRIVALKHEKMYLETEFETRSNQQQLESWNDVDFGYVAPGPGQFIASERQLAALGKPALVPVAQPAPVQLAAAAGPRPAGGAAPATAAKRAAETASGDTAVATDADRNAQADAAPAAEPTQIAAAAAPAVRLERIALAAGPAAIRGGRAEVGR